MEANKKNLTGFINNQSSYTIPFFQRSYVWGEEQWEHLLNDVIFVSETKRPLFLGALIFKKLNDPFGVSYGSTVIDGQQRLTTLFIFFRVLTLITNQSMWFNGTFMKLDGSGPVLTQSHSAANDFNRIMGLKTTGQFPDDAPNSQINKAFRYFHNRLREIIINKENKDENGKTVIDIDNIYKFMNFVEITLDENEDEQQIFDTINSLGVKLTTGELLKNYLFSQTEPSSYEEIWKPVFENDAETIQYWDSLLATGRLNKKTIDVFLYYFLQIKTQEPGIVGDKKLYRRWENLFSSYKTLVEANNIDKTDLAWEIAEYAKKFASCFVLGDDNTDIPSKFGIERISFIINELDSSTLIPYVLYILTNVSDNEEQNKIFAYLEKYIVRRLISDANNANYSDLFSENLIGQRVCSYESLVRYISTKNASVSLAMPSDEKVTLGFTKTPFKNNKKALSILYLLETLLHTDVHSTKLKTFDAYSLEHLMPKKWKKHWPQPTNITEAERDDNLITLGNLALITKGLNNSIRNYDWETKKSGKKGNPGLNEFAAGIKTITPYLDSPVWDEDTIKNRALDLASKANLVWDI